MLDDAVGIGQGAIGLGARVQVSRRSRRMGVRISRGNVVLVEGLGRVDHIARDLPETAE
jgi:hypothetical protein